MGAALLTQPDNVHKVRKEQKRLEYGENISVAKDI